jgi:iron complex outermembrane receptor protein
MPAVLFAEGKINSKVDTTRVYKIPSITVSSTHANENDSPVPFSEINKSEIEQTYSAQDLPQILGELPSILTFSENGNGIGYTNLSLRGFDQRRISVMVNGIPQNDPEDHNFYWINISDFASTVENIQVQRGAGLSSYGPAAIGGSILLSTVNYAKFKGVNISSGIGFQEYSAGPDNIAQISSRYAIEFSSGLVDNYAFYAKLGRINSFGYRDQSWANLNSYFFSAMRFDKNLTTQLNIYGGSQTDGLAYNGLPYSYIKDPELRKSNYSYFNYDGNDGRTIEWTTKRRNQEVENFSQPQIELLNDWKISDNLSFKSSLFLKMGDGYFDYDGTGWTDTNSFRLTSEYGFIDAKNPQNPIIRSNVGNRYGGWIPKFELKHDYGNLMFGAEVRIHRSGHWGKINYAEDLPTNYDPDYKFYSYNGVRNIFSIFASENLNVSDDISIAIEGQLVSHLYAIENEKAGNNFTSYNTSDGKIIGNGDRLFEINYLFFNPRIGINYNFIEDNRVYFSSAFTSREPRMKNLYAASDSWTGAVPLFNGVRINNDNFAYNFSQPLIKPEQMLNFEIGWAYNDGNSSFNINGYWMEYFDELVKSGQLDLFGAPMDGNAPKTRHYGIEVFGTTNLLKSEKYGNVFISGNLTYSKNTIIEYNYALDNGDFISLKDNSIAGFPDLMANLRLSYSISDLFTSVYFKYVDDFYTDNFGELLNTDLRLKDDLGSGFYAENKVESYYVVNADISYTFRNIEIANSLKLHLQINNLTNELYAASGFGREFFPAAERNYFFGIEIGL